MPRKAKIHREEVKERHTSHWDMDFLPREELDRIYAANRREEKMRLVRAILGVLVSAVVLVILLSLGGCATAATNSAAASVRLFQLDSPAIDEASGVARSLRDPNLLWVHNDSGSMPVLYAIDAEGKLRATLVINGPDAFDWEDMASFWWNDEPYLLIADVGDNRGRREEVQILVVREPVLGQPRADGAPIKASAAVAWQQRFRYEDGPRDCEAVAVDAAARTVWLLSKRDRPPRLYRLPLNDDSEGHIARFVSEVDGIPRPTLRDHALPYGAFRSQPTAMDLSPNGSTILVQTYKDAYLFDRTARSWPEALSAFPRMVDTPQFSQTEAAAWRTDRRFVLISEKTPARAAEITLAD